MTHNTFAEYERNPNLRPTENRVAAFCTGTHRDGDEVLYAAFHDGRFSKSSVAEGTTNFFNHDSRRWVLVDSIPNEAEFIGRYAPPPIQRAIPETDCREYDWTNG